MRIEPLRHMLDANYERHPSDCNDHSLDKEQPVACRVCGNHGHNSAAGKDAGESTRRTEAVGCPSGKDAANRCHPDRGTRQQSHRLDAQVIMRRNAWAECGSREPHKKAPEKSQSSDDELLDLMRPQWFSFSNRRWIDRALVLCQVVEAERKSTISSAEEQRSNF